MTSHLLDLLLKDKPHDASRIVNLGKKKKEYNQLKFIK